MVAVRVEDDDVPDPFFSALMSGVDVLEVAQLVERPAWMADALCAEYRGLIDFFPERGHPTEKARAEKQRKIARRQGWTAERLLAYVTSSSVSTCQSWNTTPATE